MPDLALLHYWWTLMSYSRACKMLLWTPRHKASVVLLVLFLGKHGGGGMGEKLSKFGHACGSMLCVEFHTPCVLQPKKKMWRGCGSNTEQRRPEIIPSCKWKSLGWYGVFQYQVLIFQVSCQALKARTVNHRVKRGIDRWASMCEHHTYGG